MRKLALSIIVAAFALLLTVACGPLQLDLAATATAQFTIDAAATRSLEMTRTAEPSPAPDPTQAPEPPAGSQSQTAKLWCAECERAGMGIYLWDEPRSGAKMTASVPHKTEVSVLEQKKTAGSSWYRVRCDQGEGWVSSEFVIW